MSQQTASILQARRAVAAPEEFEPGRGAQRRTRLADLTDAWLRKVWEQSIPAETPMDTPGLALVAVGGHARRDAGPYGDLDLVLLHDGRRPLADVAALADRLWYPMWDDGVRLDHSVRTPAQCREVALGDLPATIGLLDSRLVAGDADLAAQVRSVIAHDWRAQARQRLPEFLADVRARHERHGTLADLVEPDLKEAAGGLRDTGVVRALIAAWLADRPHGAADAAYATLLDVRDAVHVVTGRGRDRLVRQDHEAVADLLGYGGARDLLRAVSEAGREVAYATESTIRRAGQSQAARAPRSGPRRPQLTPLGYGVFSHDGEAVLGPRTDPSRDPYLTLRAAQLAAAAGLELSPATVTNLARQVPPLPTPWPAAARSLFGELLATGEHLVPVWESLVLSGIVESWLPAWSTVRSVPQVSPVHRHTVDRHQVETVAQAQPLLGQVRRPDLLLVAALLHDMGKAGASRDDHDDHDEHGPDRAGGPDLGHAASGAPVAAEMARDLGFTEADVARIELLVREHLTLVELATTRDARDPAMINDLLHAIDTDPDTLELLRALTEADARAAGPQAWTHWRARLVDDLTESARRLLRRHVRPDLPEPITQLPPGIAAAVRHDGPQVQVQDRGADTLVVIAARDRVGLFADVAGLLSVRGLTVTAATLATVDGIAYDSWLVHTPYDREIDAAALARALRRLDHGDQSVLRSLPTGLPLNATALPLPAPEDLGATVLELRMPDRRGLLHDVGAALAGCGVSVRSASVGTYAGRAVDTFLLTEPDGAPLAPNRVAQVVGMLGGAVSPLGGATRRVG